MFDPDTLGRVEEGLSAATAQQLNREALKTVGKIMLGGLGAGMALRGGKGLINALTRTRPAPPQPIVLDVPFQEKDEKRAQGPDEPGWIDRVAGPVAQWGSDVMKGRKAETVAGVPWVWPAALLGGVGASAVGWKGLDSVLAAKRKRELEQDLEQAEQRYRQALVSGYKTSSDNQIGRALEGLVEKQGQDWPGILAGTYMTAAPLLALMAGSYTYGLGKKRTRRHALEQAKKLRQRRRFERRAPEIFARPVPLKALPEAPTPQGEVEEAGGITEGSP
jgi:hypothetical protein